MTRTDYAQHPAAAIDVAGEGIALRRSVRGTGSNRRADIPPTLALRRCPGGTTIRRIVLHADDFGMNTSVTDGILRGFDDGLLTSTSLLSNAPDAARALECWQQLESRRREGALRSAARRQRLDDPQQPFDLGIHLNLTQGRPLTGARFPAELLDREGRFPGIFGLFRRLRRARPALLERVEDELACQVQFMLDCGHRPMHLNGHQYIELLPPLGRIVESLLERFGIRVVRVAWEPSWRRSLRWPGVLASQWLLGGVKKFYAGRFRRRILETQTCFADTFFGTMTAGRTSLATFAALLAASPESQLIEIGLHPADCPGLCEAAGRSGQTVCSRENETVPLLPPGGWHDALATTRPRELQMVLSTDLDDELIGWNCRLGRLAS